MTCIVGVVDEQTNRVYMGGDSCGSGDNSWALYDNAKVFVIDNMIFGGAGNFRMIDLLAHSLIIPDHPPEFSDEKYLKTLFIDSVKKCLIEGGVVKESDGVDNIDNGDFLLGYRGMLYHVQEDFSVLKCKMWGYAIGAGEEAARGSLWTTQKWTNPVDRVYGALEAAEFVVSGVRAPFTITYI